MIKITTRQKLLDFKGQPLLQNDEPITIGTVVGICLSGKTTNPTLAWTLGKKFTNDKEVELKAEDVVFLKETLDKNDFWTSIVIGQVLEILDGTKEIDIKKK